MLPLPPNTNHKLENIWRKRGHVNAGGNVRRLLNDKRQNFPRSHRCRFDSKRFGQVRWRLEPKRTRTFFQKKIDSVRRVRAPLLDLHPHGSARLSGEFANPLVSSPPVSHPVSVAILSHRKYISSLRWDTGEDLNKTTLASGFQLSDQKPTNDFPMSLCSRMNCGPAYLPGRRRAFSSTVS